ncbi:sensor histidine kinase [Paraflavitalea pollutisoli]|uniref:sensor histidine kinase n=1 Tax=Paraflavitalea pollutisoli TaxID=3034143 RepID=UPI0023ED5823|nr:sensor histidine kinase [Paraflavitalea sp. H1-2-19X]
MRSGSRFLLLASIILQLCLSPASGQEYSYARYDVDKGLVGSVVYDGAEDKDGFLWFATETGVSRFDGTHFRNFTKADGLPDNEIIRIYVDSRNRVWMLPFHNSICYYQDGKIYTKDNDSLLRRLNIDSQIQDILEDKRGNLVIRGFNFFYLVRDREVTGEIRLIHDKKFYTGPIGLNAAGQFCSIVMYNAHASPIYLVTFNTQGQVLDTKEYLYRPISHLSTYLHPAFTIFRRQDSLQINRSTANSLVNVPVPEAFNGVSGINDSLCFFKTGNGAILFNVHTMKAVRQVLKGKTINNVFQDSEGNWWFLTGGSGVFRVGSFEFTNFEFSQPGKEALAIFSTLKKNNKLYVGAEKSMLFTIDMKTRQVASHHVRTTSINAKIAAMAAFPNNDIIIGTDEGIYRLGPDYSFTTIFHTIAVKAMRLQNDEILLSAHSGMVHIYPDLSYRDFYLDFRSTCSYKMQGIYYSGAVDGLYIVDSSNQSKKWLGDQHPLLRNRITSIEGGADNTLWIGTHGDGIIAYKDGKVIGNIRQSDGLTSNICRTLFIDGHDIWVGTDKGLNRVRYVDKKPMITTFSRADGLIADIVNTIYVDSTTVFVGTPAGLTTFDANKISHDSYCKLRITGIQAAGRGLSLEDSNFTLQPSGNAVRFAYVGISYRSAGDITYRYRLAGLDDEWQTTRETFLNYPSLPSGDYQLQLTAINKFGIQSDTITIPFQVARHFWEMTWFRLLAIIIIWALVWIFVSYRIKKIKRQNEEKMQISNRIADLEQMALKAQMNPHFIFNSLNSVQQYVIDKDILGANKFITEFSRLIRLTLDISSKTRISLYEEISYLTTYLELEKTKFEDKFSYKVEVAAGLDTAAWSIPPMILQPYVENSIRHGVRNRPDKLGMILVSFRADHEYLICCVEDNGVGRKKAAQYKSEMAIEYQSKGMTLTARRIEMLNKHHRSPVVIDIEDLENNRQPAGTRVTLKFPLQDAAEW